MLKILIIEGNTADLIERTKSAGAITAAGCYKRSLALHDQDAQIDVCVPFAHEFSDHDILSSYDGFALTGSGVNWSAGDPEVAPYMAQLEAVFAQGKPVVGSCWGMQTVAQLFGGTSVANEKGTEIGIAENITLTPQGRAHPVFEGVADIFASPCIHRDHITRMPEGFEILAANAISPVQAMASNRSDVDYVGFQFHPEFDLEYIQDIISRRNLSLVDPSMISSFQGKGAQECEDEVVRTRVFANWLNHVRNKKTAAQNAAA